MQNAGFLFAIMPALKRIYPDKEKRLAAMKSHNGFFNTHPYMANIIMGLTVALEEESSSGKTGAEDVQTFKSNIAGPLAAIGDSFFWATWRPFCALLVVSLILIYSDFMGDFASLGAIAAFLVLYNSLHFAVRYAGLKRAYDMKTKILKTIAVINTQKMTDTIRAAGIAVTAATVVLYAIIRLGAVFPAVVFAALFLISAALARKSVSPSKLFYMAAVAAAAAKMVYDHAAGSLK
jgi:PTS system mannose-specific IID component